MAREQNTYPELFGSIKAASRMNDWAAHPELNIPISWLSSGDPGCPYFQIIDGVTWKVLVQSSGENEPVVYALSKGDVEILDFDEWPALWSGILPLDEK